MLESSKISERVVCLEKADIERFMKLKKTLHQHILTWSFLRKQKITLTLQKTNVQHTLGKLDSTKHISKGFLYKIIWWKHGQFYESGMTCKDIKKGSTKIMNELFAIIIDHEATHYKGTREI